jgi:ribosome-binding protein aMBF1 (putative translation factor)
MNKKHIGASVFNDVKRWKKDNPAFRKAVDEYVEKAKLAMMLKEVRQKEGMSQTELAEKAKVPQSVIARIETCSSRTLPRLDLFNHILNSVGYETFIVARKNGRKIEIALAA